MTVGAQPPVGGDQPSFHSATSASHPGFLEFDAGSGTLEREGSSGGVLGKIEGALKMLGFEEEQLISTKNP